jgi:hypothetical protein
VTVSAEESLTLALPDSQPLVAGRTRWERLDRLPDMESRPMKQDVPPPMFQDEPTRLALSGTVQATPTA